MIYKRKFYKLNLELKTSILGQTMIMRLKPQSRLKKIAKTHLVRDFYPKFTKNSYNSKIRKENPNLKNGLEEIPHQRRYVGRK